MSEAKQESSLLGKIGKWIGIPIGGLLAIIAAGLTFLHIKYPSDGKSAGDRFREKIPAGENAGWSAPTSLQPEQRQDIGTVPDALERKLSGQPLAMHILRNLDFSKIDLSSPAQKEHYLKTQFNFFMSKVKAGNPGITNEQAAALLSQDGSIVDLAKGTYENIYVLNGQATPYNLTINGVNVGTMQIIRTGEKQLETALLTGGSTPNEINIAGVTNDFLSTAMALNWKGLSGGQEQGPNGVYTYLAALGAAIANNPSIVRLSVVDRVSFFVLNEHVPALNNLGYLPEGSITFPDSDQVVRGLRVGGNLGVVRLSPEQLKAIGQVAKDNLPPGLNNKNLPALQQGQGPQ